MPARFMPSTSSKLKPESRSITSTRRVTSFGCGRGHDRVAHAGVGQHRGDVEHVLGFEPEVELLDDRLREQLDERRRVGERRDRDAPDHAGREPRQRGEVLAHQRRDARPLDLDHDLFAGQRASPRAPGRSTRPRSAPRRSGRRRAPSGRWSSSSTTLRTCVERLGRDLVAQQLELGDELFGEEPLAARDDLAELDVGGAEPLERRRSRREMPARDAGVPRSADVPERERGAHRAGDPEEPPDRRDRRRRREHRRLGADSGPERIQARAATRSSSGTTIQGGVSLNAPSARSAGGRRDRGDDGGHATCHPDRRASVRR